MKENLTFRKKQKVQHCCIRVLGAHYVLVFRPGILE